MPQGYEKNGGPPCPKVERLEELMEFLTSQKVQDPTGGEVNFNSALQECVEALDWTHTMLSNRKHYQKRAQITKKISLQVARSILGKGEMDEIKARVDGIMKNDAEG